MKRSLVKRLLLLAVVAAVTAPLGASAQDDEETRLKPPPGRDLRSSAALRTSAAGETTFVGWSPAYAGRNHWSIGVGNYRPHAPGDTYGYWDMDHPVQGDSLMGWWTVREIHSRTLAGMPDYLRPMYCTDFGNQANFVQPEGKGRTFGVIGIWHTDRGNVVTDSIAGSNVHPPLWASPGSGNAAWCGVRGPGDLTAQDPITGNHYNAEVLRYQYFWGRSVGTAGRIRGRLPGYAGGWDQMLYRDVAIPPGATAMTLSFKYQTAMSTDVFANLTSGENARTGWFHLDPVSAASAPPDPRGNFISAEGPGGMPRDSFMVYVGQPVEPVAGEYNDFVASDGNGYELYDPLRRWFSEVLRIDQPYYWLFGVAGNHAAETIERTVAGDALAALGPTARIVFRVKTGRGYDDFYNGSLPSGYSSGYQGAAQVDDVSVTFDVPGGFSEDFEDTETALDPASIDNRVAVPALEAFKSTGKPPATYAHLANVDPAAGELIWEDECGPPATPTAKSNMRGEVFSMGNREGSEALAGAVGTSEQEWNVAIVSPSIDLVPVPAAENPMGLTESMLDVTGNYCIRFSVYAGAMVNEYGVYARPKVAYYPARQADGAVGWSDWLGDDYIYYWAYPSAAVEFFDLNPVLGITTPGSVPLDSLRFGIEKSGYCQRFAVPDAICGLGKGFYIDDLTLALVDAEGTVATSTFSSYGWLDDAFPAGTAILPGTAAFDTTTAHVKSGNIAANTGDATRFYIPADSVTLDTGLGTIKRIDLVFRINPGPGNYVVPGERTSGLRRLPTAPTPVTAGDGSFWSAYIADNGARGTPGGHPPNASYAARWDPLVWNSARCDTAHGNLFPLQSRGIGGVPTGQYFVTTYHEEDPKYAVLGIPRNKCFLVDPAAGTRTDETNITCGRPNEPAPPGAPGPYPPDWVTIDPVAVGYDGNPQTVEGTKILPDGLFTPGTHIQYFYRNENLATGEVGLAPDTSVVFGPLNGGSRWLTWSVLPDLWKKPAYGGLGLAPLLAVNAAEQVTWSMVADMIGATGAVKRGAHDGWSNPSGWTDPAGADLNDPAYFVRDRNAQPGTTWDLFLGSIGSRNSYSDDANPANLAAGKTGRIGPTIPMMEAYYNLVLFMSGWNPDPSLGPFVNNSADDKGFLTSFLIGTPAGSKRGLWCYGENFVGALDPEADGDPFLDLLGVRLESGWYGTLSANPNPCPDVVTFPPVNPNGDIYGVVNNCWWKNDVLATVNGGLPAAKYEDFGGGTYFSSVYRPDNAQERWISLVDGWDLGSVAGRFCDTWNGRIAYVYNAFANLFGAVAIVNGTPGITLDAPNTGDGRAFAEFLHLRNNPVRSGVARIDFGLAKGDRVTLTVYDVAGRQVRKLLDGQLFKAGEHSVTWDGVDDGGRRVRRGVYFAKYRRASGTEVNTKVTILR